MHHFTIVFVVPNRNVKSLLKFFRIMHHVPMKNMNEWKPTHFQTTFQISIDSNFLHGMLLMIWNRSMLFTCFSILQIWIHWMPIGRLKFSFIYYSLFARFFRFDSECLMRFILTVRKNYRNVPYNNWSHAFSVAHSIYTVIKQTKHQFTPNDVCRWLISKSIEFNWVFFSCVDLVYCSICCLSLSWSWSSR